jgi:hypothetical protein
VGHRQALQRLPQPAATPGDQLLYDGQAGFLRQHLYRSQPTRQLRLRVEARHHRHRHIRIQRPQDRDGHHLVAHHLRKRAERGHRVIGVPLAEVEKDLFGIRPADSGQARPGDYPIIVQQSGIRHVTQGHW